MILWLTAVTGLVYPLIITGIAEGFFKQKAEGSMVAIRDKLQGSKLIGQRFESAKYFWGRPSATNYHTLPGGGSSLGPTSASLKALVEARQQTIGKESSMKEGETVPPELLYASASGIDPHISPSAALFQISRIALARGFSDAEQNALRETVEAMTIHPFWGLMGSPLVNVLELNLALDRWRP